MPGESLGARIARLRNDAGWTQQELADRIAISRVAISHLEMGISVPSERTVALLAGAFHVEPHQLVEGTAYPSAKAERLPLVAARYTEAELQLALMRRDLDWLRRLGQGGQPTVLAQEVLGAWRCVLARRRETAVDPRECQLLEQARAELAAFMAPDGRSARRAHVHAAGDPR
jgi:transcriptional regulator with XRE-family HTH domain